MDYLKIWLVIIMNKRIKDALILMQIQFTFFTFVFTIISLIDKLFFAALQLIIVVLMIVIGTNNYSIFNRKKMAVVYWVVAFIMVIAVIVRGSYGYSIY